MKLEQKRTSKKGIKQVTKREEPEDDERSSQEDGGEQYEWRWCDTYGHYLCVTVPVAKRPRTEDDGGSSSPASGTTKGGGKGKTGSKGTEMKGSPKAGKGSGKGGPKGGKGGGARASGVGPLEGEW